MKRKIYRIFFVKTCLTSKSSSGNVEPVLTTLLTILRQKSVFSTKIWKTPPPPAHAPVLKKLSNWTFFQGKFFSRRKVSLQIKTQFSQSAFKVHKTSAECLEKVLKTLIQPRKKTVYLKKSSWIVPSCFDNHVETFQKQYVFLFLNFRKTNPSTSEKSYPIAYNLPGKKSLHEKIALDIWNPFLTIGWNVVVKVRQNSAQVLWNFRKHLFV